MALILSRKQHDGVHIIERATGRTIDVIARDFDVSKKWAKFEIRGGDCKSIVELTGDQRQILADKLTMYLSPDWYYEHKVKVCYEGLRRKYDIKQKPYSFPLDAPQTPP